MPKTILIIKEMDRATIINGVRSELIIDNKNYYLIKMFPTPIQEIILDLIQHENMKLEFIITAMLSAAASAIGNSYQIRVKSEWTSSPMLYFLLVGRPGIGKSTPASFFFKPLRDHDQEELKKYEHALHIFEEQCKSSGKYPASSAPKLKRTVISDFSPEALLSTHASNPRGIAVVVDEILALFKSIGRYSIKSNLIELMLSAYSGQPLDSIRKTNPHPLYVKVPCLNLIGTIQTKLVKEVIGHDYSANGLVDRFLFVTPLDKRASRWNDKINEVKHSASMKWAKIMNKLISLDCDIDPDGNAIPRIIDMTDAAAEYFRNWYNSIIDEINDIEDDEQVDSRMVKQDNKAARIALIIQLLHWATGNAINESIELDAVKSAIRLVEFFEGCFYKIQSEVKVNDTPNRCQELFNNLPEQFSAKDAIPIAEKMDICERSAYQYLDSLCRMQPPQLKKTGKRRSASYTKVH